MKDKFCENLKAARRQKGFTQKQVAEQLNVIESCYGNWEQGRTEPSISSLRKLCEILDVEISDLIN